MWPLREQERPVSVPLMRVVRSDSASFAEELGRLGRRGTTDLERVEPAVRAVLAAVRAEGDRAVARCVREFEGREGGAFTRDYGGAAALATLPSDARAALELSAARVRAFHERQRAALASTSHEADGVRLETRVLPVSRVGVYVPGGKASYPSSVLMSALVAKVAGVADVVVATPNASPAVRAAMALAGVDGLLDAGGAQAIAALAYGTETVPRVDKIVGPGNLYVAAAKRLVFGEVAIDSIAGPSEILVIADETAVPAEVAADLLSQAEHDEAAYPLLLLSHPPLLPAILDELAARVASLPKRPLAEASLRAHGVALLVAPAELGPVATRLAVEHVALHVADPRALAEAVRVAGALFLGRWTPEAVGDYVAGPSHVLPTGGAARFSSPLGVYDFVARTSMLEYTQRALTEQADAITTLARLEGLEGHARAVEARPRG